MQGIRKSKNKGMVFMVKKVVVSMVNSPWK